MNLYPSYGLSGATKSRGISGTTKNSKNALDVNVVGTDSSNYTLYESKTFTITGAETDYNVKTAESMFATVTSAKSIMIYTDIASEVNLNLSTNNAIALLSGEEIKYLLL